MQVLPPALAPLGAYRQFILYRLVPDGAKLQSPLKRCRRCGHCKPRGAYGRASSASDGLQSWCKECKAADFQANKEKRIARSAELAARNPERAKATKRKCYLKHKERYGRDAEVRYAKNKTKILAQAKLRMPRVKQRLRERYANDLPFRLHCRIGPGMRRCLRGGYSGRTMELVGYTIAELKAHLESLFTDGMCWERISEIHIDHIRPVSSFNITSHDCDDFKACWALSNLQPLWARDNLRKHAKYPGTKA